MTDPHQRFAANVTAMWRCGKSNLPAAAVVYIDAATIVNGTRDDEQLFERDLDTS